MPEQQTIVLTTWADAVVTKAEPRDAEEVEQAAPEEDQEDQEEQS